MAMKNSSSDDRRSHLSRYQARRLREYEAILEAVALNPERVLYFAKDDPAAVVPVLKSMTDQAVRSCVIFHYTEIDQELEHLILRNIFGPVAKLTAARKTRRYRTVRLMLMNTYLMQKLAIVRSFKSVPKPIAASIAAINDLRNGLAHTFFLDDLPPSKRTYKGHDIFTRSGLEVFNKDIDDIRYFFMPWLRKFFAEVPAATAEDAAGTKVQPPGVS